MVGEIAWGGEGGWGVTWVVAPPAIHPSPGQKRRLPSASKAAAACLAYADVVEPAVWLAVGIGAAPVVPVAAAAAARMSAVVDALAPAAFPCLSLAVAVGLTPSEHGEVGQPLAPELVKVRWEGSVVWGGAVGVGCLQGAHGLGGHWQGW